MIPMFSILIPVCNAQKYLRECVDSVMKQGTLDFEVLLLDDGSVDESPAICREYEQKYANVRMMSQKNAGPLLSRKRLLEAATGSYCIFSDADDYWERGFLDEIRGAIKRYPECDMICFGSYRVFSNVIYEDDLLSETERIFGVAEKKQLCEMALNGYGLFSVWGKAFRKEIAEPGTYEKYGQIRYAEDRIQVMQMLLQAKKIICLPKRLYYYRAVEGSLTQNVTVERFENMYNYTKALELFMREGNINTEKNRKIAYTVLMKDFLDSLLKFDTSGEDRYQKKQGLDAIRRLPYYELLKKECRVGKLPVYHKIRYYLLDHKLYNGLLLLDEMLFAIKKKASGKKLFGKTV